ncbi:tripartite tricarboxylate transporter TctB family protein [Microbacterium sp. Marseille-Q6965]|uniref:tripartite tricarboxylate transporter TctB family protein n=1 Tax=Microbacterium sp. Marseille-Q6965 TaxID=2965072 RepID=UPI0021B83596|nr:tripartite tricarboxylate transporter TctB family protein [Microbacterium sp. Marseille-Q6965]
MSDEETTRPQDRPGLTTTNLAAIEQTPPPVEAGAYPAVVSGAASFIVGVVMAVAGVVVIVDALRLPPTTDPLGPAAFPLVIGSVLVLLGVALLATNARFATVLVRSRRSGLAHEALLPRGAALRALGLIAALIGFAVLLPFVGFFVAAVALYAAAALLIGAPRGWHLLVTGVLIAGFVVLIFDRLIGLTLPAGPWGF